MFLPLLTSFLLIYPKSRFCAYGFIGNWISVFFLLVINYVLVLPVGVNKFIYFSLKGWRTKAWSAWSSASPCCSRRSSCPHLKESFKSFGRVGLVLCHKKLNFLVFKSFWIRVDKVYCCSHAYFVLKRNLYFW